MTVLDVTIVNVALPSIGRDLGSGGTDLQWVVNAYVLTFAGFLLVGGRATDLFDHRALLRLGLAVFAGSSIVGGLATSTTMLVVARASQGLGAALMSPAGLKLGNTHFHEPARRARASGIWGSVATTGAALGAAVGGLLTGAIGWRAVLFVNAPIAIVAAMLTRFTPANSGAKRADSRLDVVGAVLVTGGLATLVYGVVNTDRYGWGSARTVTTMALGAIALATLVLHQRFVACPLLPLELFRMRGVTTANVAMVLLGGAGYATWYFQSQFLQNVLRLPPSSAGVAFLPVSAMAVLGAQLSSRLVVKTGVRPLLCVGAALMVTGELLLARSNAGTTYFPELLLPAMTVTLGTGLSFTPLTLVAIAVHRHAVGLAASLVNVSRQVGVSFALAILTTVAVSGTRTSRPGPDGARSALAAGYANAFAVAAAFVAAGWLIGLVALPARAGRVAEPASTVASS